MRPLSRLPCDFFGGNHQDRLTRGAIDRAAAAAAAAVVLGGLWEVG